MTISLTRPNSVEVNPSPRAARVVPADVWDIERRGDTARNAAHVRTLETGNRKYSSEDFRGAGGAQGNGDAFESRREKAGATILGAFFGIALIIGSAFGGAFSGGDAGFAPHEASQQMVAAIQ